MTSEQQQQDTDLKLTSVFEYDTLSSSTEHKGVFFMNTIQAPEYESESRQSRAAIDVVCVIDKSGSMSGTKIELVRKTLGFMVEQLKQDDKLSLVAFDSNVSTEINMSKMTDKGKQEAKSVITKLKPGSCTNLSGGLFQAFDVIKQRKEPADVVSVLLFTDGLANVGITSAPTIVEGVKKFYEELGTPCSLFTFGFGQDHDANMLRAISEAGNGMYYYIQKEDEIPESFGNCLGGLLSVVAQNIKLTIESVNENVKIAKILSGFRKNEIEQGKKVELLIGDLYSEEKRDIIVQVDLPSLQAPTDSFPVFKSTLSYFNVITTSLKTVTCDSLVKRPQEAGNVEANFELDKQRNRIISAECLQTARDLADKHSFEEAKKILEEGMKRIQSSKSSKDEYCQGLVTDMKECLDTMTDTYSYTSVGSKMMNNYIHSNVHQRQTNSKSAAQKAFLTKKKMDYSERATKSILK